MRDGRDWTGLLFFVSAVLLSTFILLFLLSSSVSLSYFNLAVPESHSQVFGKTLVHEFPISYSHTESEWNLALFQQKYLFVVTCLL